MLKVSLYGPARWYLCYIKFAHSSTQNIHLLLYRYLFAECYHGERENSKNLIPVKIPDLYSRCFFYFRLMGLLEKVSKGTEQIDMTRMANVVHRRVLEAMNHVSYQNRAQNHAAHFPTHLASFQRIQA